MDPYDSLLKCIDAEFIFAVDVVKCSRYVQHSLTPLDLSISEYSYCLRRQKLNFPRTREALEKQLLQPSRILQTLNIDSPNHFKRRFENLKDTLCPHSSFLVASFGLSTDLYFKNLHSNILKYMEESSDKQGSVKKYMKVAQMIKLPASTYMVFLIILMVDDCQDSYLVQQVLEELFKRKLWIILDMNDEKLIDFVLFHSQKIDFDPFIFDLACTPLDYSLYQGKLRNIAYLLKYGYQFANNRYASLHFLLYTYENPEDSKLAAECFRLFWSSIPDSLPLESEPPKVISPLNLISFRGPSLYTKVIEQDPDFCPGRPRSLAHQCRCAIRTLLRRKKALPGGIELLGLPIDLQAYLRLEH